jgi:S1-C subfamily serine protease
MRMLFQERQKSSRVWMSSVAAVLAVLVVAGGGLWWHNRTVANQLREEAALRTEQARLSAERNVTQQLGASAKDIVTKYGNSSVVVQLGWRMYDRDTGRQLFHKVVLDKKSGEKYPAFIRLGDKVVRWLTLEDGDRHNIAVSGSGHGSGFVVSEQGHILTNKHVAAGWMMPFRNVGAGLNKENKGFIYQLDVEEKKRRRGLRVEVVALGSSEIRALRNWVPEDGGPVFDARSPVLIGGSQALENRRLFQGRDDLLEVRFPGNRVSMAASLVRASTDADAALIKVDSAQTLRPVDLAEDDKLEIGDKVIVLGYPAISPKTQIQVTAVENGRITSRLEDVPEPTVTEGIVSLLGQAYKREGETTILGAMGDTFQMSINSTGAGNSGGPVFNAKGKVIGLFTYGGGTEGDAAVTWAVPIKHGRALLNPQRAGGN